MEYMEYMLDKDINRQLRDVYNNSRFASMKDGIFKKPDSKKKNETYKTNAANCICACIDRIDSLVEHCNFLFDEDDSEYKLCDILNYGQTLLDCIAILAKLFEVPADKKTSSCFYELGLDGNGSDEEYFKYIRSLCSVHPVETSRHYNYQGDQSEWSPWIDVMKGTTSQVFRLLADDKQKADKADYAIIVYRNDLEYSKYVYVSLDEIFAYINKQYEFLKEIKIAIIQLDVAMTDKFRAESISKPEVFSDYESYLDNLVYELERRGLGDYYWQENEWKTILNSSFEDELLDRHLMVYINDMKRRIAVLHEKAEQMDIDGVDEVRVVDYPFAGISNDYAYSVEKTSYLLPCLEDDDYSVNMIINDKTYRGNHERLHEMLLVVEQEKINVNDIDHTNRFIDATYNVNDAEWARIQIKWMEQYWDYEIDYDLSDWYVYLQLLIIPRSEL